MNDDDSLFPKASGGDYEAALAMLERDLPRLRAFVQARTGRQILAKESTADLVQSVCREAIESLPGRTFDNAATFRFWLFKLALHKIVDRARYYSASPRDAARERPADEDSPLLHFLTPSREVGGKERMLRLERAIESLPEAYREAIVLKRIVGLAYREIGDALGRSEGAARNLVYRGLARLTSLLEDEA